MKKLSSAGASVLLAGILLFTSCGGEKNKTDDTDAHADTGTMTDIPESDINRIIYETDPETNEITVTGYSGIEPSFTIPSEIDGKKVTAIAENAFRGFTYLKKVVIPDTVRTINEAFAYCPDLEYVSVGSSVTDMNGAFRECKSLKQVYGYENAVDLDEAFIGCSDLKKGRIPTSAASASHTFSGCTSMTEAEIESGITVLDGTFEECSALIRVNVPESVTDLNCSFTNCAGLTEVTGCSAVSSVTEAFRGCPELVSLSFGNNVSVLDGAFVGCEKLKEIKGLPLTVERYTPSFKGCSSLGKIIIPEITDADCLSVYSISDDISECFSCTELTVFAEFTPAGDFCKTFGGMSSLVNISLPDNTAAEMLYADFDYTDDIYTEANTEVDALLKKWKKSKTARITEAYGEIGGVTYSHIFGSDVCDFDIDDVIEKTDLLHFQPQTLECYWCGYPDGGSRKNEIVKIRRTYVTALNVTGSNAGTLPKSVTLNGMLCKVN